MKAAPKICGLAAATASPPQEVGMHRCEGRSPLADYHIALHLEHATNAAWAIATYVLRHPLMIWALAQSCIKQLTVTQAPQ